MGDKRFTDILNTLGELWKASKEFGGKIPKHLSSSSPPPKKPYYLLEREEREVNERNYPSYNLALTT